MAKRKKKDGRTRSQRKMSRRRIPPGRGVFPDQRYNSALVSKFVNCMMMEGKKTVAETIFYTAMDQIAEKLEGKDPLEVFLQAVENVKPALEVKSRRVGGSTYQVPVDVRPDRSLALGMRWLIEHARKRNEKTMVDRLANEIVDAAQNRGNAVKKREDVHKMADANKAFAHYRW